MKMIKNTLAFAILILTGNIWAQVAPAPQSPTSQIKKGAEVSSGAISAFGSPVGAKSPRVLYAGHHRRASTVDMGHAFVKAAVNAATAQGADSINKFKILRSYLEHFKVNVNSCDQEGNTALHAVAFVGGPKSLEVINYLYSRAELNMDLRNSNGNTALIESMRSNQQGVFNSLIHHAQKNMSLDTIADAIQYAKQGNKMMHFQSQLNKLVLKLPARASQTMNKEEIAALIKQVMQDIQDEEEAKYLIGDSDGDCGCLKSSTKTPVTKYTAEITQRD